jgi:hypothetical protein
MTLPCAIVMAPMPPKQEVMANNTGGGEFPW